MNDRKCNRTTIISYAFRTAVAMHFAILYVLIFRLPYTFIGFQHFLVGIGLGILMLIIASLLVADAVMLKHEGWTRKLIDGGIACVWLAVVGYLISNSVRTGIW